MKIWKNITPALIFTVVLTSYVHAREMTWDEMNSSVSSLNYAGKYEEAIEVADMALKMAEKQNGPEHPDVAFSLNSLAELHYLNGNYTQAEFFYEQALAIDEKALGKEHLVVAIDLNNLGFIYFSQGKLDKAESLYKRALTSMKKR